MFKGSITALVTPFKKDGEVDEKALERLVEFQISEGTDVILPCGTTGESATMEHKEEIYITKRVIEMVNKRVPVIAGAGSNDTKVSIHLAEAAKKNGADGALLVTPYYNKPTQEGMYQHFKAAAEAVNIPIVMYNVPGRTGVNMAPETVVRLSKISNIVAVKEASGTVDNTMQILHDAPDFTVLSGDDALTYPLMALGAKGIISVASNIIPRGVSELAAAIFEILLKRTTVSGAIFTPVRPGTLYITIGIFTASAAALKC
ncbi:4-hydroxy-tetrahydrodipicolinate synthase [Deferribacterales bacterium RsTz2092]|nr:4-hydroxy-tetrahydrodipicolinate synthase [Deferribacterales bacterium]